MSADDYTRPVPVADEETEQFWEAARRHELVCQRCQHCGRYSHPPARFCRWCHELEHPSFRFERVSGRGKVVSWTVVHEQLVSGFAGSDPLVHVLVELDVQPGLHFSATLIGGSAGLGIGSTVDLVFREVAPGSSLPYFQLA